MTWVRRKMVVRSVRCPVCRGCETQARTWFYATRCKHISSKNTLRSPCDQRALKVSSDVWYPDRMQHRYLVKLRIVDFDAGEFGKLAKPVGLLDARETNCARVTALLPMPSLVPPFHPDSEARRPLYDDHFASGGHGH